MNNKIQIIEKPESISWDSIHDILYKAHESNRQKGVFMRTATLTGEELRQRVGENGKCFVALIDGKLAGTASVKFVPRNTWYHKGIIADLMLVGILPEYKGYGIYSLLTKEIYIYSERHGIKIVELDTAEGNVKMQSVSLRHGFQYVATMASPYTRHYSVVMVKWLEGSPYSSLYVRFRYLIQTFRFKLKFKRGRINRIKSWMKV